MYLKLVFNNTHLPLSPLVVYTENSFYNIHSWMLWLLVSHLGKTGSKKVNYHTDEGICFLFCRDLKQQLIPLGLSTERLTKRAFLRKIISRLGDIKSPFIIIKPLILTHIFTFLAWKTYRFFLLNSNKNGM